MLYRRHQRSGVPFLHVILPPRGCRARIHLAQQQRGRRNRRDRSAPERHHEETRDSKGYVDPWSIQHIRWQNFKTGHPSRSVVPLRRTPMSARACAMSSPPVRIFEVPHAESTTVRGPDAVRLSVMGDQQVSRFPSEQPCGRRGNCPIVDGIKITARRQNIEAAPCRRARRSRWYVP